MSLAMEWRHSHGLEERAREPEPRKAMECPRRAAAQGRRNRVVFACFICVAAFVCGLLLLSVFLHVMVVQDEVKTRDLERRIELEKRDQEALRVEIASLEAPSRIERIAVEELKMVQVAQAEYLETPAFRTARNAGTEPGGEGMVSDATSGGGM